MTDQKQVLIVPQNSVKVNSPKKFLVSQLTKIMAFYAERLSHINFKQWLLLLFLNLISFGFLTVAYLLCGDS